MMLFMASVARLFSSFQSTIAISTLYSWDPVLYIRGNLEQVFLSYGLADLANGHVSNPNSKGLIDELAEFQVKTCYALMAIFTLNRMANVVLRKFCSRCGESSTIMFLLTLKSGATISTGASAPFAKFPAAQLLNFSVLPL